MTIANAPSSPFRDWVHAQVDAAMRTKSDEEFSNAIGPILQDVLISVGSLLGLTAKDPEEAVMAAHHLLQAGAEGALAVRKSLHEASEMGHHSTVHDASGTVQ